MPEKESDELELIQEWKDKFRKSMEEQVELALESNPETDTQKIKEEYFLNKLATLFVGSIELGKKVRNMETQLNAE